MNNCKPVYEFLLWDNCGNHCTFCFQDKKRISLSKDEKVKSINAVREFLDSDRFVKGSHALLMGGEIFDNNDIFDELTSLIDFIIVMMKNNEIDIFYTTTNLIYKKMDLLYYLMDRLNENKLFDRFRFATSYDIEGRFSNNKSRTLMLNNLENLRNNYPDCNITINTILTKPLCRQIINNEFDIASFSSKYKSYVHLIPYIILDDKLTPSPGEILAALTLVDMQSPDYVRQYLHNLDLNQDKRLYKYNKELDVLEFSSCEHAECGHSVNFKRYSSRDTCYICDMKKFFNIK